MSLSPVISQVKRATYGKSANGLSSDYQTNAIIHRLRQQSSKRRMSRDPVITGILSQTIST